MSKIAITGAATGTATFTIESPATNTNRTLTIPDATTTIVGTDATQTLTNKTLTTPNINSAQVDTVSGTAPLYMARAWVNFNGTTNTGGNCTIRASGNVSTVADNGTGNYTVNFTTAMPDVNYAAVGSGFRSTLGAAEAAESFTSFAVGSVNALFATGSSGVAFDTNSYSVAIFR